MPIYCYLSTISTGYHGRAGGVDQSLRSARIQIASSKLAVEMRMLRRTGCISKRIRCSLKLRKSSCCSLYIPLAPSPPNHRHSYHGPCCWWDAYSLSGSINTFVPQTSWHVSVEDEEVDRSCAVCCVSRLTESGPQIVRRNRSAKCNHAAFKKTTVAHTAHARYLSPASQ